jgi:hypothetical protein
MWEDEFKPKAEKAIKSHPFFKDKNITSIDFSNLYPKVFVSNPRRKKVWQDDVYLTAMPNIHPKVHPQRANRIRKIIKVKRPGQQYSWLPGLKPYKNTEAVWFDELG